MSLDEGGGARASPTAADVVVVGAGPVGLSLALALARDGRAVLVLEKEARTAEHSRAPAIWPRTLEILADLGVGDSALAEGIVVPDLELFDVDRGSTLLRAPLEELADRTAYPHLLVLPQSRTEELLLQAVRREEGAEVRFSSEVTAVSQERGRVTLRVRRPDGPGAIQAAFVVGCDGAHSTVRKAIGASFDGDTYAMRAALADIRMDGSSDLPFPRLTTRPRPAIGIRIAEDLWRLILPFRAAADVPLGRRVREAASSLFDDPEWTAVWESEFSLHRRVSSAFVEDRVALAGDAAHLNSPVGGQGMNAGIQDTAMLAPALGRALDGAGPAALSHYGRERRRQIRTGVNRFTDVLTRLLLVGDGRLLRPMLRSAGLVMRVAPVRRRILARLAMLE